MRELRIFSWFGYELPLRERLALIAAAGFEATFLWLGPDQPWCLRDGGTRCPNWPGTRGSKSTTCMLRRTLATAYGRRGAKGIERIRELVDLANAKGVQVAVENGGRPDYADYIFSECQDASLGFCYDSSHDLLKGNPPTEILRKWGHRLLSVHLSDNKGQHDDHLLPGEGSMGREAFAESFPSETYAGPVMLEARPDPSMEIGA